MYTFFEKLIDPLRPVAATQPPLETARFIWYYIRPIKGVVLVTLLLSGIAAICELYLYAGLGHIVDWMAQTEPQDFFAEHGLALLLLFVLIAIVRPLALLATRCLINLALGPGIVNATRWQNHRYVLRQSMTFFQNDFAGRIAQKVMQTGHALREIVINVVDGVWLLVIYLIGIAVLLVDINLLLCIPIAIWVIAYLAVVRYMVPPVRAKSAGLSEATSALTGRVVDSYTNIQSVKLFAHNELEEEFVGSAIRRHVHAYRRLMRSIVDMTATLTLMNTLLIVAMAGMSIMLWQGGSVSIGEIAIANGLVIRLNQMSGWILRTITSLFESVGTIENGMETISQPTDIVDAPDAVELHADKGRIVFENVSFHYARQPGAQSLGAAAVAASHMSRAPALPVIDHCDIDIAAGEKVGLVGRSGAGKSTLINLLLRFHDLQGGAIRIDGQNIRAVTQHSLRSQIAVVTQDTSLLHRSVRDNIRYGRVDASEEVIIQAATLAEAMEFIPELQDVRGRSGLDATVGERGVKLSGGQRQRLAIARVILKDAPILILDEATSALDSDVEAAIQQQLNNLMRGKTVLAVAHRLSTIAALDRLVVLDGGRIVESGPHAQLLENGGLYAQLWRRQSGGFLGV